MSVCSGLGGSSGSTSIGGRSSRRSSGPRCICGRQCIVYTSKTENNPNRAFFGCPFFKEKKPYCKFFKWVDEVCNEWLEAEGGTIYKLELDVAELDFRLKYMNMKLTDQLQVKLNEQEAKINEMDQKIKDLSLIMVSEIDGMEKDNRNMGRSVRVFVAAICVVFIVCILVGLRLGMKEYVPSMAMLN